MTFADRFISNRGEPFDWDGQLVYPIYRRQITPGECITVSRRSSHTTLVQGLCVKVANGSLRVAGQELDDIVLWNDTAPDTDILEYMGTADSELKIWNCWRDDRGVMDAWTGNAGMLIEELDKNSVRLRCNSRTEVTFSDLIVDLHFERRG